MADKPHVIVLMADQLRWDALGEHTPNINQLLSESFTFKRAYCASPLCVPARGSFFTGRYPNETGSIINPWAPVDAVHGDVRPGIPNLYQLMEKDWDSRHTGKQHLYTAEGKLEFRPDSATSWSTIGRHYQEYLKSMDHRPPGGPEFKGIIPEMVQGKTTRMKRYSIPTTGRYEHGFDSFIDGFIANQSVKAIKERDTTKPLLLNAMFVAPHPPYDIPEPWYSKVSKTEIPANVGVWYPDQSPLQLYNLTGAAGTRYTREDWSAVWPVYLGLVALLDHAVGMIIEELKTEGMYEDSIILFTTDHGEMLGSHCLYQKMCMYEESVRAPIAFKLPVHEQRTGSSDELVSAIDVLPTICELTGLLLPIGVTGESLVPVMKGGRLTRDEIFAQFDGNGARGNFQRAVLRGPHKLIVDIFKDEIYLELYDVDLDPQETNNLAFAPDSKTTILELLAALESYMSSTGDMLALPMAEKLLEGFLADYAPLRSAGT